MTHKELQRLSWRMQSHLAMVDGHSATYEARIGFKTIVKCVYTVKKDDVTFGRSYTHYRFDGKVYKSHTKVLEAINDFIKKIPDEE